MRRTTWVLGVLGILLLAGVPAEAKPLSQTHAVTKATLHDVLTEVDHGAAKAQRNAYRMVKEVRQEVAGIGFAPNGELDLRASFAQPVVRGQEDFLSLTWVAAKEGRWTGVYWIESNAGVRTPKLLDTNVEGVLLFLDMGATPLPDEVAITYHFLGVDGRHTRHDVGVARILEFMPLEGKADFGAVAASHAGHPPEGVFLTPWNTLGENVTMGMTLVAGDHALAEVILVSCIDYETETTEYGCRLLYVLPLDPELTGISLWHLDASGERIVDRDISRAEIDRGYQFPA